MPPHQTPGPAPNAASARPPRRAPVIAVIGCDGSGKSTVSAHLLRAAARYGPAAAAHLGKQSGNIGRALARLPLVGRRIGRTIKHKTAQVHQDFDARTQPGLLPALVIVAFMLRRVHRFRRMLALRRRGFIIVTDRYPQVAVPNAYDGPALPADGVGNPLVRWLARYEWKRFTWMASHRPDVVIRLNVDLDTACARKPDHDRDALKLKIDATPRLGFQGAPIVDLDAAQPLDAVLAAADAALAATMARAGYPPAAA